MASARARIPGYKIEERYQTALGLKHDLERCLQQWQETGKIQAFELGQHDISDRLIIPDKLYGRETEAITLLQAFERVSLGATEMMQKLSEIEQQDKLFDIESKPIPIELLLPLQ